MSNRLIVALASLTLLMVMFVPLERAFPARPHQRVLRTGWKVDLCFFFGQYLVWNALSLSLLTAVDRLATTHPLLGVRSWAASLPSFVQAAAAVVLGDMLVYWFHRACHTFEPLWRFHAVHHSAEHLDFLAAHREHPLDGIVTQLCANLPAFLLGFDAGSLAGLIAFRGMWAIFVHSNVRLPLGPLRTLFGAPELHHWHHARVARTEHNFANLAPWIDHLFGTHHDPQKSTTADASSPAEPYEVGLTEAYAKGYAAQLVRPFLLKPARARGGSPPATAPTSPQSAPCH